jgi:hypothetical protein
MREKRNSLGVGITLSGDLVMLSIIASLDTHAPSCATTAAGMHALAVFYGFVKEISREEQCR